MIKTKEDLKYYIEQDRIANKVKKASAYRITFYSYYKKIWNFLFYMRKCEYHTNARGGHKLLAKYYEIKKDAIGGKLGFSIPVNTFE